MVILLALGCTAVAPKGGDTAGDSGSDSISDTSPDSTGETDPDSDTDTGGDTDSGGHSDTSPAPTDADGDGYGTIDEGGDDCDDADAMVHPGAEEWCDLVDQDCDGEALAPGVCAKIQEPSVIEARIEAHSWPETYVSAYRVIGDLDGDGLGEIYVACWDYCGHEARSYQILQGGIPSTPLSVPKSNLQTWYLTSGEYGGQYAEPAGDVNGDGIEDLAFLIDDGLRGLFVQYGPFDLAGGVFEVYDVADVKYLSEPDGDGTAWGYPYIGGVDFDGDGRSDFAVAPAFGDREEVQTDIFFGGSAGNEYTRLVGPGADPVKMPDLDGDGLDELWLSTDDIQSINPGWIGGANLRGADGARADDVLDGVWEGAFNEPGVSELGTARWRSVGDWDGDGHPELVAGSGVASPSDDITAEILFFGGDLSGWHTADDAVARLEGTVECTVTRPCNDQFEVADFDGDGILDIVSDAWETSSDHYFFMYPGQRGIPLPGATYVDDTYRWYTDQQKLYPGDVDADGYDDLMGEFTALGDIAAIRGWAVPWDDPVYW